VSVASGKDRNCGQPELSFSREGYCFLGPGSLPAEASGSTTPRRRAQLLADQKQTDQSAGHKQAVRVLVRSAVAHLHERDPGVG